jgi:hypothetical protein
MSVHPPAIAVLPEPTRVVQSRPVQVVQSHPEVLAPIFVDQGSNKNLKLQHPKVLKANKKVVWVSLGKPILTLWGLSHLAPHRELGPNMEDRLRSRFQRVINKSKGGARLTNELTDEIVAAIKSHPGPNQVYFFLFGGNILHKTTEPILEVAMVVLRFCKIMIEAQKAGIRVLLCGTISDPRPVVDAKLNSWTMLCKIWTWDQAATSWASEGCWSNPMEESGRSATSKGTFISLSKVSRSWPQDQVNVGCHVSTIA